MQTINEIEEQIRIAEKTLESLRNEYDKLTIIAAKRHVYEDFFDAVKKSNLPITKLVDVDTFINKDLSITDYFACAYSGGVVYLINYLVHSSLYSVSGTTSDTNNCGRLFSSEHLDDIMLYLHNRLVE